MTYMSIVQISEPNQLASVWFLLMLWTKSGVGRFKDSKYRSVRFGYRFNKRTGPECGHPCHLTHFLTLLTPPSSFSVFFFFAFWWSPSKNRKTLRLALNLLYQISFQGFSEVGLLLYLSNMGVKGTTAYIISFL